MYNKSQDVVKDLVKSDDKEQPKTMTIGDSDNVKKQQDSRQMIMQLKEVLSSEQMKAIV